ncbi:MAG: nucleoside triphosphate pyrophosphohydrolase [Anaerolineaceae bacterium]|nr:nucleoside triphosphate pyrophosphohydrolase [Anaerolineaceae bacterium]
MTLTLLGLGPGEVDDLSRRAWRTLKQAKTVIVRTSQHNCVPCLPQSEDITYQYCDDLYEGIPAFADVYNAIVERVMTAARQGDVVYAVPGDPLVGESTVLKLLESAKAENIKVEIVSGISFVEPILAALGVDAMNGLQILDGIIVGMMHHPPINPDYPALLGQVYSREVAGNVKLTLMNQYPDEFEVALIHAAGTDNPVVEHLLLYEIDRSEHIKHMTSLYVPALGKMSSFEQFQEIIAHLRAPEGCPWDKEQTHLSLRRYLLEETHEVLEALDAEDEVELYKEMGDLLLQIVLHTQIAIDDGEFKMSEVISHINRKLIHRHPHVWGDVEAKNAGEVLANWDALKQKEHAEQGIERKSVLDGIPKGLPALMQALRYQEKAAKVHFDWESIEPVIAKVREEIDEVLSATDDEHRAEEIGDLLFVIANWARWLKVDPEIALRESNAKFYRRFRYIEENLEAQGKSPADSTLAEMDALWDKAKAEGL